MDIQVLTRNIQDLQAHFTTLQNLSPRTLKVWCVYLSENLTEEELEQAVDQALVNYGCNYDLSAKSLVDLAKGSERELVLECWARAIDAIARRIQVTDLDDASQYAITELGGMSHLSELPIPKLQDLKFDFQSHWQKYRKKPVEFRRPTDTIPPEQREFKPEEFRGELSEAQKAKNEELRKRMLEAVSFNKKLKNNGALVNEN